ncbi:MAG: hypothetical protein H0W72_06745 [Planctomycetes bacterium]|nr:hypothetical protein [Planctomycetota bacterium]
MRKLLILAIASVIHCGSLAAASDSRDVIVLKAGDQKRLCFIDTETDDGKLKFRNASGGPVNEIRISEVRSWEYFEMKDGAWAQGVERRDGGKYAEAADLFNTLATSTGKEWQKVYGAYQEGVCLELAGNFAGAATAFARVASGFPTHRLALEATFRQGFALARAGKAAEASKVADQLTEIQKKTRNAGAESRANAIRAVNAANDGKADEVKKLAKLAMFSAREEPETYLQFGLFVADFLRAQSKFKDAELEYRRMLNSGDIDPAKKVQLSLGYGMCLVETDKPSALVELLKLDALPYGSAEQKCEARYWSGKLILDDVKAAKQAGDDQDEKKSGFIKEQLAAARFLLQAAADSSSTHPSKGMAKAELDAMGPDPDAPVEAKGDQAGAGAAK